MENKAVVSSSETVIQAQSSSSGAVHPGAMIQALMNRPDIDIEKLERFYDLQVKYEDNEARKAFHKSMSKFHAECPEIKKNRVAKFDHRSGGGTTEYEWADLAGIIEQIKDAMALAGLSHNWTVNQEGDQIKVTCYITHELGYQIETSLSSSRDTSGTKNSIQAMGSTIEYLKRYTLKSVLGLADSEMDDDGVTGGVQSQPVQIKKITADQAKELSDLYKESGGYEAAGVESMDEDPLVKFLMGKYGIEQWDDLPAVEFDRVKNKLDSRVFAKKEKEGELNKDTQDFIDQYDGDGQQS